MLGQHTEKLSQYVTKGKAILVEGELNIDNYEKDGERRIKKDMQNGKNNIIRSGVKKIQIKQKR